MSNTVLQSLVRAAILTESIAHHCQTEASNNQQSFIQYIVEHHVIDAAPLASFLSTHFKLPLLDLNAIAIDTLPLHLLSEALIRKHRVLPLFTRDNHLYLAVDCPSDGAALKELQFYTRLQPHWVVVESDKLQLALQCVFRTFSGEKYARTENDDPVISLVQHLLTEALLKNASDIHFEPYETFYRVRYRIDGLLTEVAHPALDLAPRITARLKILAHLNTAERRLPQDGRFHLNSATQHPPIECRISTCPTAHGEKVVVRLLDPSGLQKSITELGFDAQQQEQFLKAIQRPLGLIIVTGPTGSGKSFTLYHALSLLNQKDVNICSVEDPVEIKIPGVNQVNIHPKTGLGFSNVLRSFLRQDPDIIMIGEIRDHETAELAVSAAQTGHLVLSTLHTNTALEALSRLKSMGISNYHLAHSLTFILSQRLVRKLCEQCKVPLPQVSLPSLMALGYTEEEASSLQLYRAQGCPQCTHGYKGRIGLFELLSVDQTIEQFILNGTPLPDIRDHLEQQGMKPLYRSGLEKIQAGLTTLEELNRVAVEAYI